MHHNTESLQNMLTIVRDSGSWDAGVPFPTEVEDTGEDYCRVCEHKRSAVDGAGVCLVCVIYLYMKPSGAVVVLGGADEG